MTYPILCRDDRPFEVWVSLLVALHTGVQHWSLYSGAGVSITPIQQSLTKMRTTNNTPTPKEPVQLQDVLNQFTEMFSEYYNLETSSSLQANNMLTDVIIPDALSTLSWTIFSCLLRHICYSTPLCYIYDYTPLPTKFINDMTPGFIFASTR